MSIRLFEYYVVSKLYSFSFLGEVNKAFTTLGIKKFESRPYHPQSQGKVERSHGTWKAKLRYDISQSEKGEFLFCAVT